MLSGEMGGCLRVDGSVQMGTALCQGVILAVSPDFHIHSSCLHGGGGQTIDPPESLDIAHL